ncbi:MAG: RnfABCDGE type electron transport complex subunit D [Candidatus Cloacimonetes bacterium]|nr:RnfABCDGE type electron transport complex subunit D [Candidatus Cloacimonadota bacterium]
MSKGYVVSASPHLHDRNSVAHVMWQVVIALLPAMAAAIFIFGINSLFLTIYGVIAAVVTEAVIQKLRKKPIAVADGSAVVTGILLAFNLNVASPWWLPVVGSVFAIAIGKHVFGGLGHNPLNPALLGRAFLVASWPSLTTSRFTVPKLAEATMSGISNSMSKLSPLVTEATPLAVVKTLRDTTMVSRDVADKLITHMTSGETLSNLFWGNIGGVIGEVSAAAILIGAAYLAWKRIIEWRIPVSYIGTVFVLILIFGGIPGADNNTVMLAVYHILAGGLMLGAFFMATDMVTSPVTKKGRLIFGCGCGVLTVVIRLVGGYPEGVSYSILLMNIAVPLIDRFTTPKPFGEVKK